MSLVQGFGLAAIAGNQIQTLARLRTVSSSTANFDVSKVSSLNMIGVSNGRIFSIEVPSTARPISYGSSLELKKEEKGSVVSSQAVKINLHSDIFFLQIKPSENFGTHSPKEYSYIARCFWV